MVWFHSEVTWENIHINLVEIPLACILAMIFGLIFVCLKDDVHQTAPLDKNWQHTARQDADNWTG